MNITSIKTGIPNCAQTVKNGVKTAALIGVYGLGIVGCSHFVDKAYHPREKSTVEKIPTYVELAKNGVDIRPYLDHYPAAEGTLNFIKFEKKMKKFMEEAEASKGTKSVDNLLKDGKIKDENS